MRPLWKLLKLLLALAIGIPLAIIVLSATLGLLSAVVGLAFLALRIALVGLVIYVAFRLLGGFFGGSKSEKAPPRELPQPIDPYYEAAKRELDREIHGTR